MAELVTRETLHELLQIESQICLSLYMPIHRKFPQSNQDLIRYKNLLKELRHRLEVQHPEADHQTLMQPFEALMDDEDTWIHRGEGLAVLGGEHFFKVLPVQRSVPERVSVNTHPYVKPLIRIVQSADSYQVLCLSRDHCRLFEGNRDQLSEVEMDRRVPANLEQALGRELSESTQSGHPGGFGRASNRGDPLQHESAGSGKQEEINLDRDRYFRELDRAVFEHHSKPSGLPLILVALPENEAVFRSGSHNRYLVEEGVSVDPASLDTDALRQRCWDIMSKHYQNRLQRLVDEYGESRGQGLASDRLEEIGPAIANGRVATLLVEAERMIPGQMNLESGEVSVEDSGEESPDILDELVLKGMQNGGDVVIVPRDDMPVTTGAAALYRY